jgi:5-formyltetrahydrofolate cyclo-ligase
VAWPRIRPGDRCLDLAEAAPGELVPGPVRALEPPPGALAVNPGEVDLVVVPAVAFDAQGHRLGRGGGYYDATLAVLPPRCFRAGLAFDLQIVPSLPLEPHDARVDAVVTESRVILTRCD